MPTREGQLAPTKTISRKQSKKFKMTCDERLSLSRKLSNISRKQVENLKGKHCTKRPKNIEQPADDSWLASGGVGSRDAVLVFRASVLKPHSTSVCIRKDSNLSLTEESLSLSQSQLSTNKDIGTCYDSDKISCNTFPISPLPSSSGITSLTMDNLPSVKPEPNNKLLPSIGASQRKLFVEVQKSRKQSFHKAFLKPQANVIHSLSSSDNSIYSEGDGDYLNESNGMISMKSGRKKNLSNGKTLKFADVYNTVVESESGEEQNKKDDEAYDEEQMLSEESAKDVVHASNMPALQMKIKYKFMQTETKLLRKIFIRHGLTEVEGDENFSILWTGIHMKPDILRNLAPYQRVNHFPRSYELTRKDRLYKNIERMQHLRGPKHFDIVPQSFMLPMEYKDLVSAHNKHRGPWIVKPAASSRGRGIFIVNTPDQIPQDEQVLVSKYVADPLCIDGHKCDIRVYVLVTSFDPLIIYIYEEGLVRLATVKYDRASDNLWNPCMHLCNYSINKYHSDYIKSSDAHDEDVGHKWTLSALLRHLKSQGCDTRQLMSNIEDLIIKAILCCAQSIISACRMFVPSGNNCFELYGFDILIDDSLKPWLLEVNLSPSMGVDSPLDSKVKACLITDLLTCVGIPAYTPSMRAHYDNKWTRFRNVSCSRRTTSADSVLSGSGSGVRRSSTNGSSASPPLTIEEQRIVRNARLQNARRGGFVLIFPTDDTMQRYGSFLDPSTGIPLSTPSVQGQVSYSMILPHNYNLMLFNNLYGNESRSNGIKEENSQNDRIAQYERALPVGSLVLFNSTRIKSKCLEEGKRLRKQILKMIDNGSELTQLQARQAFALYLDAILRRLSQEPRDFHEKLILKFLNRIGGSIKAPVFFRNPQNIRNISKARSAMVAKLLGDFLEQYNRDTEAYVDAFDHFGMIPTSTFSEFLSHAQEADLEAVLTLHTNLTCNMPFLYNRCGLSVPPTPPIPSGMHGFLRALPAMVLSGSGARDFNKYDGYYKSSEKDIVESRKERLPDVPTKKKTFTTTI